MNTAEELANEKLATPGPWDLWQDADFTFGLARPEEVPGETGDSSSFVGDNFPNSEDVLFISHARTGYPLALAVVEAVQRAMSVNMFEDRQAWIDLEVALDAWEAAQ